MIESLRGLDWDIISKMRARWAKRRQASGVLCDK